MPSDPSEPPPTWILHERRLIGERLRDLRHRRNLTQITLGERIGTDNKTISRIENAVVVTDIDTIVRLAHGLGVPAAWFFSDDWRHSDGC